MAAKRKEWSQEEQQRFRAMIREGVPRPEIARILGRGLPGLQSKLKQLRSEDLAFGSDIEADDVEEAGELGGGPMKGAPSYDRRHGEHAVRAASDAFSAALRLLMARRRSTQAGAD